jgi:hypothetical protein
MANIWTISMMAPSIQCNTCAYAGMPAGLSGVCRTFCAYDRAGVGPAGLSGVGAESYNTARRLRACGSQWGGREGVPTRLEGLQLHARQLHTELHPQPGSYGSQPHNRVSKLIVRGSWFRLLIACEKHAHAKPTCSGQLVACRHHAAASAVSQGGRKGCVRCETGLNKGFGHRYVTHFSPCFLECPRN